LLRQLAGPFDLTDDEGTALTPHTLTPVLYYPGFGLVMKIAYRILSRSDAIALVTLDGVAQPITTVDIGGVSGFGAAFWAYDDVLKLMVTNSGMAREKVCLGQVAYPGNWLGGGTVILADSTIGPDSGRLMRWYYTGELVEISLPSGFSAPGNVGPGRQPGEVFVSQAPDSGASDVRCFFYDTNANRPSSQVLHLGDGVRAAVYDTDSGVIISFHDTPWGQKIWSLDVVPNSLSAVTLKSGAVAAGTIAVFQVQVQGADGDWVENCLVDWSLTGAGTLLDSQSKTDATGFASCRVFYAGDIADGTGTFPTASVTC
jgi:hypothetical protein